MPMDTTTKGFRMAGFTRTLDSVRTAIEQARGELNRAESLLSELQQAVHSGRVTEDLSPAVPGSAEVRQPRRRKQEPSL
jgi:hypothetical protein